MLLGHLAVPTLLKHYLPLETGPLYAGSFFPDVVDKTLHAAGLAANGRTWAHTLLTLTTTTLLVYLVWGAFTARSWFVGYLAHLLCDVGGDVPWFYPFMAYEFRPSTRTFWQKLARWSRNIQLSEVFLVAWALLVAGHYAGNGRR